MFCPNCGTKNADDDLFCASCGARLEAEPSATTPVTGAAPANPVQAAPSITLNKLSKTNLILLVEAVALIILLVVLSKVGQKQFSSEKTAENYFLCVMNADWDDAYDLLDLKESDFITKDHFIQAHANDATIDYANYNVGNASSSSLEDTVTISYKPTGASTTNDMSIVLNKQSDKNLLFFDNWKVSSSNYIFTDFSISVPSGASVTVDDIALTDSYKTAGDEYDTYIIPSIFAGTHSIVIAKENMETVDTTFSTYDYSYSLSSMEYSTEVKEALVKQAGSDFKSLFDAAISQNKFDTVKALFSAAVESDASNYYSNFCSQLYSESSFCVNEIKFSDIKAETTGYSYYSYTQIPVTVSYSYDMKYSSVDWWSGDWEENTDSSTGSMTLYYTYTDGSWVISSVDYPYFYIY